MGRGFAWAGTKPRCRCCQSRRSAAEAPGLWQNLLMEGASISAAAAETTVRPSARAEKLGGCGWLEGLEARGLGAGGIATSSGEHRTPAVAEGPCRGCTGLAQTLCPPEMT